MNHTSKEGGWTCPLCKKNFKTRKLYYKHKKEEHQDKKRLDEKDTRICCYCQKSFYTTKRGISQHEDLCSKNPNKKVYSYDWCRTEEFKKHHSELMKMRHKNGTASSFKSRKKQSHSYPEKWLITVLENNFGQKENIDYKTELPFHGYFLDFSWPEKRLCIEIDGELHRFAEQQNRDKNKDEYLRNDGWKELRLKWSFILKNKETTINMIKDFLMEIGNVNIPLWKSFTEKREEKRKQNELNGVLKDSLGRFCPRKLKEEEWNERKRIILNSGVDFKKYGWRKELERKTALTRKEINNTIQHFKNDFDLVLKQK